MFKIRKGLLAILILMAFTYGGWSISSVTAWLENLIPSANQASEVDAPAVAEVISPHARVHILYGDKRGGGHMHGAGKPCKSEFPAGWDIDKILVTVSKIAANDNVSWRQGDNGYWTGQQTIDGVKIRVVKDREGDNVITAYPLNTPKNPCPAANDNDPSDR